MGWLDTVLWITVVGCALGIGYSVWQYRSHPERRQQALGNSLLYAGLIVLLATDRVIPTELQTTAFSIIVYGSTLLLMLLGAVIHSRARARTQ